MQKQEKENQTGHSRVLKFRAWDIKENYMIPDFDNWIDFSGKYWTTPNKTYDTPNQEIIKKENVVLMQYTGLKDRNGKEIFEEDLFGKMGGDKDRPNEYEVHGQVKYDDDFAQFVVELTNGGWITLFDYFQSPTSEKEIIGDIYQNYKHKQVKNMKEEYKQIALLISSIFFYGNFKAETANERELEKLLREVNLWPTSEKLIIERSDNS